MEKYIENLGLNDLKSLTHRLKNIALIAYTSFIYADNSLSNNKDFSNLEYECSNIIDQIRNTNNLELNTQYLMSLLEILKRTKTYIQLYSNNNDQTKHHFNKGIQLLRDLLDELIQYQSTSEDQEKTMNRKAGSDSITSMLDQIIFTTVPYLIKNGILLNYKDSILDQPDNVRLPLFLLRHSIFELIKNSVDMLVISEAPSKIIELETFRYDLFDQPYVGISISDNGPGVPPGYEEKIFEKDFTTKSHGTGLGLWDIREIISPFGGILRLVPSSVGAKFELLIPLTIDSTCQEFNSIITGVMNRPED